MAQALIRGYDNRYALNDLWGAAFGDSPDFISAMYDAGYLRPSDVFALTEDGRLLCAVFLPEYRLCLQGRDYPIRLLSCVATDPQSRGKGYMTTLLRRAVELVRGECDGICVIPVSESLCSFYAAFGFRPAFYCSQRVYPIDCSAAPVIPTPRSASELYSEYERKYHRDGCVFKTMDRFAQAITEYEHPSQASLFLSFDQGFAFVQKDGGEVIVREWSCPDETALAAYLIERYGLPVRIQDFPCEDSDRTPMGMLLPLSQALCEGWDGRDLYLNCMYN